jgi:DNA modification methylase
MNDPPFKMLWLDSRRVLDVAKAGSVNLTLTSPPYWGLKDYGFPEQIGRERNYEKYLSTLQLVFSDVFKATKQNGSLWLVADTVKRDGELFALPFDLANKLKAIGWRLQDVIIWDKMKTLPWSAKGMFRDTFEYVLFFSKDSTFKYHVDRVREPVALKRWWVKYPERYNPQGKDPGNIWRMPIPTQGSWSNGYLRHFCPFPPALVERVIELTTDKGDTVLDCFAGSGVVVAQAHCMGRKAIGLEMSEQYVSDFSKRVLPEIQRLWQNRAEFRKSMAVSKRTLSYRIQMLRKLKYSYILLKETAKRRGITSLSEAGVNSVFSISRPTLGPIVRGRSRRFLFIDLFFVLNPGVESEEGLYDSVVEVTTGPFLSAFGVEPRISLNRWDEFLKKVEQTDWSKRQLWLYSGSRFNYYLRPVTLDRWKRDSSLDDWKKGSGNVVPLISNLKVRQPVVEISGEQMVLDVNLDGGNEEGHDV